MGEFLLRKVK